MRGSLFATGTAVLDWYWQQGFRRSGEYDLSGAWLDQLYQVRQAASALEQARTTGRPCLALWGPSQSGKSTLLSRYLDVPRGSEAVSALQWGVDAAVALVGRPDLPGCIHLNPYNQQRDASGCATRFTLRHQVADPRYPVELKLASEPQTLHALATGYLMECDTRNAEGRERFLDAVDLDRRLSQLKTRYRPRPSANRPVRELLQAVLDVLDDLIATDWARYRNLRPDWHSLRSRLASDPLLGSDAAALAEFAAGLLWDGEPALTGLWQGLLAQRNKILHLAGARPILCSYEAARLFLDIDAFRKLEAAGESSPHGPRGDRFGFSIVGAGDSARGALTPADRAPAPTEALCLGAGLPNPLFADPMEFGLWQGLVWEMTVPINAGLLPEDSPAARLLRAADLLDFPGVALTYPGGERKRPDQMPPGQLLTEVLKRGKTSSLVVTRSRQLGIDGFSILNRIQAPPAQPTQLLAGVRAWARALGQPWPPSAGTLPINLVLTFAARLVNGVVDSLQLQRPSTDFSPVFEFLNKLGDLANPQWVQFFTTTYPRFDEGCIRGAPEELERAAQLITGSEAFRHHLGDCSGSLAAMIQGGSADGDGGNDYFLEALAAQARGSRMPALLDQRAQDVERQLAALLDEALPPTAVGEARRTREIKAWRGAIEEAIDHHRREHPQADGAAHVSRRLRALLNVDPESLEPVPLGSENPDWRGYVERQFARWRGLAKGRDGDWRDLGLKDAASTSRHLGYLADPALIEGRIPRWLRDNLGHLARPFEGIQARRFLAIRMGELIRFGAAGRRPHRAFATDGRPAADVTAPSVQPRLRGYAAREQQEAEERDDRQSPHYLGFIAPFLEHLEASQTAPATARKPQSGDAELTEIDSGTGRH